MPIYYDEILANLTYIDFEGLYLENFQTFLTKLSFNIAAFMLLCVPIIAVLLQDG